MNWRGTNDSSARQFSLPSESQAPLEISMSAWFKKTLMMLVMGAVVSARALSAEPKYEGKTLDEWLSGIEFTTSGVNWNGADRAVVHLGTNAIPVLLARAVRTPNWFTEKMLELDNSSPVKVPFKPEGEVRARTVVAFRLLGTNALLVLPKIQALRQHDHPYVRDTADRILKELEFGNVLQAQGGKILTRSGKFSVDESHADYELRDCPDGAEMEIHILRQEGQNRTPAKLKASILTPEGKSQVVTPVFRFAISGIGGRSERYWATFTNAHVRSVSQITIEANSYTNVFNLDGQR